MDIRRLEHFIALHEHGSFHKAAEAVHLSQSALSRSIQALEAELDVTLFDRYSHRSVLTPAGHQLLAGVRKMLMDAKELRREIHLFKVGDLAEIRFGSSPTPGAVLLRPVLIAVTSERPRLHIDARIGSNADLLQGLHSELFDFAVLDATSLENQEGLAVELLPPQPGGFLVRRGHPLLEQDEIDIEDIRQFPVTGVSTTPAFGHRLVEALGADAHPSRLITHFCDNHQVQRDLALRTDTVILTLYSVLQEEMASGAILPLRIRARSPIPVGYYAMVRLAGRSSSPALDFVQGLIRKAFQSQSEAHNFNSP